MFASSNVFRRLWLLQLYEWHAKEKKKRFGIKTQGHIKQSLSSSCQLCNMHHVKNSLRSFVVFSDVTYTSSISPTAKGSLTIVKWKVSAYDTDTVQMSHWRHWNRHIGVPTWWGVKLVTSCWCYLASHAGHIFIHAQRPKTCQRRRYRQWNRPTATWLRWRRHQSRHVGAPVRQESVPMTSRASHQWEH